MFLWRLHVSLGICYTLMVDLLLCCMFLMNIVLSALECFHRSRLLVLMS